MSNSLVQIANGEITFRDEKYLNIEDILEAISSVETPIPDVVWDLLASLQANLEDFKSISYHQEHINLIKKYKVRDVRKKEFILQLIRQLTNDLRVHNLEIALFYAQYLIQDQEYEKYINTTHVDLELLKHDNKIKEEIEKMLRSSQPDQFSKGIHLLYTFHQLVYGDWDEPLNHASELAWWGLGLDQKCFESDNNEAKQGDDLLWICSTVDDSVNSYLVGKVISTLIQMEPFFTNNDQRKVFMPRVGERYKTGNAQDKCRYLTVASYYVNAIKNNYPNTAREYMAIAMEAMKHGDSPLVMLTVNNLIHHTDTSEHIKEELADTLMIIAHYAINHNLSASVRLIAKGALTHYVHCESSPPWRKIELTAKMIGWSYISTQFDTTIQKDSIHVLPVKPSMPVRNILKQINSFESAGGNIYSFQLYVLYLELAASHIYSGNIEAACQAYRMGKFHQVDGNLGQYDEGVELRDDEIALYLKEHVSKEKNERYIFADAVGLYTAYEEDAEIGDKDFGEACLLLGQRYRENGNTLLAKKLIVQATYCDDNTVANEGRKKYNEYFSV